MLLSVSLDIKNALSGEDESSAGFVEKILPWLELEELNHSISTVVVPLEPDLPL